MPRKAKVKEAEKENGERWLVTYSDLITLLLVFFIILYASSNQDTAKMAETLSAIAGAFTGTQYVFEGIGDSPIKDAFSGDALTNFGMESRDMEQIKQEVESIAESLGEESGILGDSIEVVLDDVGVHIRIKDAVLFNSGSATINVAAMPMMNKIGIVLKKLPNNYIQIEGHTDNIPMGGNPNIPTNWELGSLRAVNVLKSLVQNCGLNPKYLNATSYGEFKPIDTNTTVEGRARNRRVEITILRNYTEETGI